MTKVSPRQPTQIRETPWPFLYSGVPGRGVVKNVPAKGKDGRPKKRVKILSTVVATTL